MTISEAKIENVERILFVINESNRKYYKSIVPPEHYREPVLTHDELLKIFETMTFFTFKEDNEIVGVAALEHLEGERADLHWVYILPDKQKKGVGTSLVKHIEVEAKRRKIRILRVPTAEKAFWARSFYLKLGYEITGREERPEGFLTIFEKQICSIT